MVRFLFYILILLSCVKAYGQELYKYTDENGVEHIVDSPYKLPEGLREKYIKEYEKKKKPPLPSDLQDTRPAYKDVKNENLIGNQQSKEESLKEKKKAEEERRRKIDELSRELEETITELGYKRQRALITQIPALKEEVQRLQNKVEEIKKELEKLNTIDDKTEK